MKVILCFLLFACFQIVQSTGSRIELEFSGSVHGVEGSVSVDGQRWFSLNPNTAFYTAGQWHSQNTGNFFFAALIKHPVLTNMGTTLPPRCLGHSAKIPNQTLLPKQGSTKNKDMVVFRSTVVREGGIKDTAVSGDMPIYNFPSVLLHQGLLPELGYAYFHGLWPQPVVSKNLTALNVRLPNRHEGPILFTSTKGSSVLLGPINDPLNTVFQIVKSGGRAMDPPALAFGPSAMLTSLPYGYSNSIVLLVGNGATETIGRYGPIIRNKLQYRYNLFASSRLADPFVEKLSAWTDNGAYYFYAGQAVKTLPPLKQRFQSGYRIFPRRE